MSTTPRSIQRSLRFSGNPTPTIRVTSPIPDAIAVIDIWDPEVLQEPASAVSNKSYSIRYHPDKDEASSNAPSNSHDVSSPTTTAPEPIEMPPPAVAAAVNAEPHGDSQSLMVLSKMPEMETDSGSSDEDEASQATTLARTPRSTITKDDTSPTEYKSNPASRSVSMDCSDFPPPLPASDLITPANSELELPWPPVPCCTPEKNSACSSIGTTTPDSIPDFDVHPDPAYYDQEMDSSAGETNSSQRERKVKNSISEKDLCSNAASNEEACSPRRQSWSHGHGTRDEGNHKTHSAQVTDTINHQSTFENTTAPPATCTTDPVQSLDEVIQSNTGIQQASVYQKEDNCLFSKASMGQEINIIENPSCAEENDSILAEKNESQEYAPPITRLKKSKKVQFGRSLSYSTDDKSEASPSTSAKQESSKYYLGRRASSYDSQSDRTAYLVMKTDKNSPRVSYCQTMVEKSDIEEEETEEKDTEEVDTTVTPSTSITQQQEPILQEEACSTNISNNYCHLTTPEKEIDKSQAPIVQIEPQSLPVLISIPPIEDDKVPSIAEEIEDDDSPSAMDMANVGENVEQFKKDPQLMEIATRFVAEVVVKAKEEAARRAKVEKMNLELEGATHKNLPWYRRIRVVILRAFSCTCTGSGPDLQSPL